MPHFPSVAASIYKPEFVYPVFFSIFSSLYNIVLFASKMYSSFKSPIFVIPFVSTFEKSNYSPFFLLYISEEPIVNFSFAVKSFVLNFVIKLFNNAFQAFTVNILSSAIY